MEKKDLLKEAVKHIDIESFDSSTIIDATIKMTAEDRLAIRKPRGSILYFPPYAALPNGNPRANNI